MTDKDLGEMAASLSEAQRNAVLHGRCGVPRASEEWSSECICAADGSDSLVEIGLAVPRERFPGGIILSPSGLALRQHLQGETL